MGASQDPPEDFDISAERARQNQAAELPGIVVREPVELALPGDDGSVVDDDHVDPDEQVDLVELASQVVKDF